MNLADELARLDQKVATTPARPVSKLRGRDWSRHDATVPFAAPRRAGAARVGWLTADKPTRVDEAVTVSKRQISRAVLYRIRPDLKPDNDNTKGALTGARNDGITNDHSAIVATGN
jgi:hypothetical protein